MRNLLSGALAAAVLLVSALPALAEEKIGDTRVSVTAKLEVIKLDDVEGHIISIAESKGYDLKSGTWVINRLTSDLVKGNGTHRGYTKSMNPDGDVAFSKWEGRVTTTMADGKPRTTFEGTWTHIGGTGKWTNRKASGTYRGAVIGEGVSRTEWDGVWTEKK